MNQPMMDGEESELKTVRYARLVEYVSQMMFHRLFRDRKFACNLTIGETGNDGANDVQLSRCEPELLIRIGLMRIRRDVSLQNIKKVVDLFSADPELSCRYGSNAFPKNAGRRV